MGVVRIESLDDPRVADYRNVKDADLRSQSGLFVTEGRIAVRRLVAGSRFAVHSVLVTPTALEALGTVLEGLPDHTPVMVAEQPTLDGVVGYAMHRGCLALGERGDDAEAATLVADPGSPSLLVALEHLTNPDNVGGIFRNAEAFGADGAVLCPRCCDPLYRKAIRVSMGAVLELPTVRATHWPGVLGELHAAGYRIVALHPAATSRSIDAAFENASGGERVVLLVGTEGDGLSAAALEAADLHVRIPMVAGVDSLNVATATGIALHRLAARRLA